MAATGYTTGDPQKVDLAGDTMTGELVLPDSSPDSDLTAASRGYVTNAAVNVTGDAMTGPLTLTYNDKIGRAHVRTPVTNAHLVCRLLLEKKNNSDTIHTKKT